MTTYAIPSTGLFSIQSTVTKAPAVTYIKKDYPVPPSTGQRWPAGQPVRKP